MISTRDLSGLPDIESLRNLTKSLATLDAILEREWEYRFYSYNSKWSEGEEMASMRNGQGDAWFCLFGSPGVFLKGFDHESEMSPWKSESRRVCSGVLDAVPKEFAPCLSEPAFSMGDTTFCIWRSSQDVRWEAGDIIYPVGEDPDGSSWMLSILDGNPDTYKSWAESYYERSISLKAIQQIYELKPLSPELVRELNHTVAFASILDDLAEINYPVA